MRNVSNIALVQIPYIIAGCNMIHKYTFTGTQISRNLEKTVGIDLNVIGLRASIQYATDATPLHMKKLDNLLVRKMYSGYADYGIKHTHFSTEMAKNKTNANAKWHIKPQSKADHVVFPT